MSTKEYDFKIGAPVLTTEGEVGRLKYVVVEPDAHVVTHLIVERGRLLRRDIIVPVGWVEHTDAEGIRLNAKIADLEGLPEFREVEFWPPDPATRPVLGHPPVNIRFWISPYSTIPTPRSTWVLHRVGLGMGEGEILIRRGLPVYTADGDRVGTVDHLLVDPARHRVTHLVIHRGRWFSQGEDYIVLSTTSQPQASPAYACGGAVMSSVNWRAIGRPPATWRIQTQSCVPWRPNRRPAAGGWV